MAIAKSEDSDHPLEVTHRARVIIMSAVLMGLFLSALDQTIVGTALPKIVSDLQGNDLYIWVVTAYLLTSTITVPIYGKFSDTFGRKPMLLAGIAIFLVGSALSGLSQSMAQLIAFRAIQGLGAGSLFPLSLAIIGDLFSPRERGKYQGIFGAVFGVAFIIGPFLGGFITDNISWHWIFYVNLPIGIVALAMITSVLPNTRHANSKLRDLDYWGILFFTLGVVPLLISLTNKGLTDSSGQLNSWTSTAVGLPLIISLAVLAIFVWIESFAKEPIIPLDLFRHRTYAVTNLATFAIGFALYVGIIFLPRYYQAVKGFNATSSGYQIWPLLVGLIGSSMAGGLIISKVGRYKWLLTGSTVILLVGTILMTNLSLTTANTTLWLWMFILGFGIGPALSGFTTVVQNAAPPERLGVATSTLTFLRQIGASIGLAFAGSVFAQSFLTKLPQQLQADGVPAKAVSHFDATQAAAGQGDLTSVGNLGDQLQKVMPAADKYLIPHMVAGVHDAFSLAVGQIFWLSVAAAAIGVVITLFIQDIPLRSYTGVAKK